MDHLEKLKRRAKALRKAYVAGEAEAATRVDTHLDKAQISHADALHVIALEEGYASWPKLKLAVEAEAMDREAKAERLKMALFHGQGWRIRQLLDETPDLARDNLGIMCALYDVEGVVATLERDPQAISTPVLGPRTPILHLAFSRWWQHGGSEVRMLATAEALLAGGGDVNDSYEQMPEYPLSALYGAIGHT